MRARTKHTLSSRKSPTPDGPAHEQQDRASNAQSQSANGERQQPPSVEVLVILPIHDVKTLEEIVEPPRSGADGGDSAALNRNKNTRAVGVGEGNAPSG